MSDMATLEVSGRCAKLMLNRPDQRNALSIELLEALHDHVDALTRRDDLSVLTITGTGRAFCAGMDLKQVMRDAKTPLQLLRSLGELTLKIRALPCVVIASVNGAAIGGGCGLTCVCDVTVTHDDSKLGFPEVDLGLCPAVVAPWVVRKIGAGRARAMLLLGGVMTGREGHQRGLVDLLVPTRDDLAEATEQLVARLASGGPHALRATRTLLNDLDDSANADLISRGAALSASVVAHPETQRVLHERLG